ncbi:MAG: chromate transporter, partial [Alphaproteobacteria bacterium]|nr:chromate transporter [Alphaproteobacteria bacterium]
MPISNEPQTGERPGVGKIFLTFLVLGATAFGGPVAHFGYFRTEFVDRRRWIDERGFADLVSLCQFLPGPASSQTGIAIGMIQRGWLGGFAAWLGFTTPAAIIMIALGFGVALTQNAAGQGVIHGLKLAAVAVVANALWGMARTACTTKATASFAAAACVAMLFLEAAWFQLVVIAAAAV